MPKTKFQGIIFGLLMSITMAYGMEVYNISIKYGEWSNRVFSGAFFEAAYMWIFVFIFSNLWGNRIGHFLAGRIIRPKKDNPFFITLIISGCTVLVMCPTMSLVATILFTGIFSGNIHSTQFWINLPALWCQTIVKNFPMAFFWNLFAAGPLTRLLFRKIFAKQLQMDLNPVAAAKDAA